jgi:ABC-type transport system substrate-binding protein
MDLLYRSMLTYDSKANTISNDITSCDYSNLSSIECFLQDDIKWSNGTNITTDDIVATYELLKDSEINPAIASLLDGTTITNTQEKVVFKKPDNEDINFLNILFQPILPLDTINSI